ncbi:MAG: DUF5591 domain-containing protein [Candidatus Altiarchaeota archaeon]
MAVLILNSGRCNHARCFFCGYGRVRGIQPTAENVKECLRKFFSGLVEGEVKVFGSGSFFDEKQIPSEARRYFIDECKRKNVEKITLESRPEFVKTEFLEEFKGFQLTVAIGLESSDDNLLKKLNKGYGTKEYETAARVVHEGGFKVRTYLLVNPPFIKDGRKNLDKDVEYALKHSDSIVLINTLPHANAPLFRMWVNGEWNFLSKKEFEDASGKWRGNPKVEFDAETFKFTPSFPDESKENLVGVGEWYLTHPHYEVWQDYLIRWYRPPEGRVLLFLPCSRRKPYSLSKTHERIIGVLEEEGRNNFHEVMLSNAGVVPREFEDRYPFESYDWDESLETPEIKARYVEVTAERIRQYLTAHRQYYKGVVCFLKHDSESYEALRRACGELDVEVKNLLRKETYERIRGQDRPLQSDESVVDLAEGVRWCLRNFT